MRKLKTEELGRIDVEQYKKEQKNPLVLILDDIRSLNNIGSIFRTADAFAINKIYLCGITAIPPHREIQKTALGATESVDWEYFENSFDLVSKLRNDDYKIVIVEQTDGSIMLNKFEPSEGFNYAIILGNEVKGVNDFLLPLADHCVEIPQFGTKHSFNVAVCNGIVLWDILLKLNLLN